MAHIDTRKLAIKAMVGSHNYNLNTPTSDTDWKYFVFPSFDDLYSGNRFSKAEQGNDMDYSCHDIRTLPEQLWKANINFIEVLFSKDYYITQRDGVTNPRLNILYCYRDSISKMNLPAFYKSTYGIHKEKMSALFKGTAKTQKLIDQFGYDTKQACHALRCLYTLDRFVEYEDMETALRFEIGSIDQDILLDVKAGKLTLEQFRSLVSQWHIIHFDTVDAYFKGTEENPDMKENLDSLIKDCVETSFEFTLDKI